MSQYFSAINISLEKKPMNLSDEKSVKQKAVKYHANGNIEKSHNKSHVMGSNSPVK